MIWSTGISVRGGLCCWCERAGEVVVIGVVVMVVAVVVVVVVVMVVVRLLMLCRVVKLPSDWLAGRLCDFLSAIGIG